MIDLNLLIKCMAILFCFAFFQLKSLNILPPENLTLDKNYVKTLCKLKYKESKNQKKNYRNIDNNKSCFCIVKIPIILKRINEFVREYTNP